MEIGTEISQKIRSAIKAKLVEVGAYVDDELPDYIMVMVANKKSQQQMADDLSLFLGASTETFTSWLHTLLSKLQSITTDGQNGSTGSTEKRQKPETLVTIEKPSRHKTTKAATSEIERSEISPNQHVEHSKSKTSTHSTSKSHHAKSSRKSTEKAASSSSSEPTLSTRKRSSTDEKPSSDVVSKTSVVEHQEQISSKSEVGIEETSSLADETEVKAAVGHSISSLAVITPDQSTKIVKDPKDPLQNVIEEIKPALTSTEHESVQTTKSVSLPKKSNTVQDTEEPEFSVRADTDEFSEEFNKEATRAVKTEQVSPAAKTSLSSHAVTKVSKPHTAQPLSTVRKKDIPKAVTSPMHQSRPVISHSNKYVSVPSDPKRTTENRRKPSSVVGNVIHKYTDEFEEEYDPHYPAVGSVASKVQVTARKSSVPKRLQANRALLLKAVTDAERSVTVKRPSIWSLEEDELPEKVARVKDRELGCGDPYIQLNKQPESQRVGKQVIVRPLQRTIKCVKVPSGIIQHTSRPGATDIPIARTVGITPSRKTEISVTRRGIMPLSNKIKKGSQIELVSKSRRQDMLRSFQYTVENKSALLRMDQEQSELADVPDVRQVECEDSPSPVSEDQLISSETEEEETASIEKEEQIFLSDKEEEELVASETVEQIDNEQCIESGQSDEGNGTRSDTNSDIEFIEQGHSSEMPDPEISKILEEDNLDLEFERGVVEQYVPAPLPTNQQRPPMNIVHGIHRKKTPDKPEKPIPKPAAVTSPKFIVTLDGVDPNRYGQPDFSTHEQTSEQDMEVIEFKPSKAPIATPKIKSFSINLADSDEEHNNETDETSAPKKSRLIERCKFWPACANGSNCPFHHPTTPCKTFPHCKFGDKCLYIHPNCKFDSRCSRKDCPFTHASKRSPVQTVVHQVVQVPIPTPVPIHMSPQPVQCRFYPNCHNMSCPFLHPKPCRYGTTCMNRTQCSFYHPAIPAANKLKWSANNRTHISERKFDGSSGYLPSGLS